MCVLIDTDCGSILFLKGILKKMIQGDIAVSNTRSAMKCEGGECLWPKSNNGLVNVPYSLSDTYSKYTAEHTATLTYQEGKQSWISYILVNA